MAEASLRDLLARLIEDTKAWAQAEIGVVKAMATAWMAPVAIALGLIVAAILLLQAALTVLVAAFGLALATWLGMAGGLAVGAAIVLLIAGILVAVAVAKLRKIGS